MYCVFNKTFEFWITFIQLHKNYLFKLDFVIIIKLFIKL